MAFNITLRTSRYFTKTKKNIFAELVNQDNFFKAKIKILSDTAMSNTVITYGYLLKLSKMKNSVH